VENLPDTKIACNSFRAGILAHLSFLKDLKLGQSIVHAVDADAQVIAELTEPEQQAQEDKPYTIRLSGEDLAVDLPSTKDPTQATREDRASCKQWREPRCLLL
jgi:hypothetical protein